MPSTPKKLPAALTSFSVYSAQAPRIETRVSCRSLTASLNPEGSVPFDTIPGTARLADLRVAEPCRLRTCRFQQTEIVKPATPLVLSTLVPTPRAIEQERVYRAGIARDHLFSRPGVLDRGNRSANGRRR